MRVAYINTVAGFNATGRLCESLALMDGIEGKIFYGRKTYNGPVESFKFNNLLGNSIHAISTFLFDNHSFVNKFFTKKLIEELKHFNPDVIHLHNLHGYYLDVLTLFEFINQNSIKVIWTLHDCWTITGHCAHFDSIGCDQWKTKCIKCPLYKNYPPTFNPHCVSNNYSRKKEVFTSLKDCTIVTPSHWLEGIVEQSYLNCYPIVCIQNGIDLSQFKIKEQTTEERGYVSLLAVASVWTKNKGLYDLVQLSTKLTDNQHLTVVGVTNKQSKLFGDNVTCVNRTNNLNELIDLYQSSDYFINFTYEDTFPTVNIEALACGTPIITYNTGGSPEIIDESTGIVIEKGSVDECIEVINKIPTFNILNLKRRSLKFDKSIMLHSYYELYKKREI